MKKPLLYPKLAWQGIRKNAEMYLPYLLMGILMVGVSYIMNYLTRPALMGALSMGGTTLMVLQMGKIVISVFSVFFLYYCNSFLIRRRMKEFGLYNILGMGKGNIARVMLWETLLTALLVFAGGLLLGLSLSRLVEMALINLLHADYTVPMELFYPDGVTWVLLLFGGIYVLILLANLLRMRLSNPVALLKSENTGEKPPKANWFFGLIGLLILLSAYYVAAVSQSPLEALIFFFHRGADGDCGDIPAACVRVGNAVPNAAQEQTLLLSDAPLHQRIRHGVPHEAQRRGHGDHLHSLHDGAGHFDFDGLPVWWNGQHGGRHLPRRTST